MDLGHVRFLASEENSAEKAVLCHKMQNVNKVVI
jgi:hypothetical protein